MYKINRKDSIDKWNILKLWRKKIYKNLRKKYKPLADTNYVLALGANSSFDFDYYIKEYNFYRKLSEIYCMMSLDAENYVKKF